MSRRTESLEMTEKKQSERDANRDPLSGRAGAHPVGTGVGALTGGAAAGLATGAALGTVVGPVGTVAGAAVGAAVGIVAGGLAGKAIAEEVNPTEEHGYWRYNYAKRAYVGAGTTYEEYAPAYQFGWESYCKYPDKTFAQVESTLEKDWDKAKQHSKLDWQRAKAAVQDAWERMHAAHETQKENVR